MKIYTGIKSVNHILIKIGHCSTNGNRFGCCLLLRGFSFLLISWITFWYQPGAQNCRRLDTCCQFVHWEIIAKTSITTNQLKTLKLGVAQSGVNHIKS